MLPTAVTSPRIGERRNYGTSAAHSLQREKTGELIMKEKLIGGIAWVLLAAGVSTADSEFILVPVMMLITGALLLHKVSHK